MQKRLLSLLLALITLLTLVIPVTQQANAAYENTYTNTGDQRADIIGVALTQVGYEEGDNNYTKYGEYHGNANAAWCGYFVSWCARQAGISTSVLPSTGLANPSAWGVTTFTSDERIPQPGDLFFKNLTGNTHMGIVYYVDGNTVVTIEGNTSTSTYDGHWVMIRYHDLDEHRYASVNYSGSEYSGHTHSYSDHYEDAHPHKIYKQCDSCGYVTYTGDEKDLSSCTECVQENCSHSYGSWETSGDSAHKRTCSKCGKTEKEDHGWKDVKTTKEATCKEAGSKEQSCSVCGTKRIKTIDKTENHSYGQWEMKDDETHKRICSVCQHEDTEEHTVLEVDEEGSLWQTDEKEHWQACEVCKEKIKQDAHEFGEDCVAPCEICEYRREDGHFYGDTWSSDEKEHWYDCENCEEKGKLAEHVYSAECDEDCDTCGYVRQVTHTFGTELTADETGHWYECDVCKKQDRLEEHTPGPEATEEAAQSCTLCGYEIVPKLAHVHAYTYHDEGTTHWGECACGELLAREAHMWDMSTGECSVCRSKSRGETEQAQWDFVWVIAGGVAVVAVLTPIIVAICKAKKKKALVGAPY